MALAECNLTEGVPVCCGKEVVSNVHKVLGNQSYAPAQSPTFCAPKGLYGYVSVQPAQTELGTKTTWQNQRGAKKHRLA